MDPLCHRCGTVLNSAEELFCPHCGAPQLRYEPSDEPVASSASLKQTAPGRGLGAVSWKTAVVSALLVACVISIPVGLLSSIFDFSSFWVIGGGIATASLYRRLAGAPLSNRMGWRVGGLLGLLSAFISTAVYSAKSVIERHTVRGGEIDQQVHSIAQQLAEQVIHTANPQAAAEAAQFARFWLSPEGSAAIVLTTAAFSAFFMVLFAAAGGAIGARIASLGNRAQRSPQ
jgi:predicted  nucleic acid-binding Zn-ribbon protein